MLGVLKQIIHETPQKEPAPAWNKAWRASQEQWSNLPGKIKKHEKSKKEKTDIDSDLTLGFPEVSTNSRKALKLLRFHALPSFQLQAEL